MLAAQFGLAIVQLPVATFGQGYHIGQYRLNIQFKGEDCQVG